MIMYSSFIVMCDLQIPGSTSCIAERLFDLHIASGSYVVEEKKAHAKLSLQHLHEPPKVVTFHIQG